jgi:hypothetical protein
LVAALSSEAVAALIGAGGGWFLGFLSELVWDVRRSRRARRVAALLVYAELTINHAAVSALRKFGLLDEHSIQRSAWEGQAPALLYGANLDRAGRIHQAYSTLEDIAWLARDEGRDFTSGEDAEFLDGLIPLLVTGMQEIAPLAGVSSKEIDRRMELSKQLREGDPAEGAPRPESQ